MKKKISLINFKQYDNLEHEFAQFNLIVGSNSIGKTTLLEAITLLNNIPNEDTFVSNLNVRCNTFDEINSINNIERKDIIIEFDKTKLVLSYNIKNILKIKTELTGKSITSSYFKSQRTISQNQIITSANIVDEENAQNLAWLIKNNSLEKKLTDNLHEIFTFRKTESELTIYDTTMPNYPNKFDIIFDNVSIDQEGYGVKQILPLLTQSHILKDSILLVENPENFLHPSAQSKIINVLMRNCKKNNNMLLIESHSDHVINAFRKAKVLMDYDVNILCVENLKLKKIEITEQRKFSEFPKGFMDQNILDLQELYET